MKQLPFIVTTFFIFINCNSDAKNNKRYDIDYLKSNKWCLTTNTYERCCEFNYNKMKITENGLPETSLNVLFEQKSDSLIIVKITGDTGFENHFKMKSLDTLYLFQPGDKIFRKLIRVL